MKTTKTYDRHCPHCNENTRHVPKYQGATGIAVKTFKFAVFFLSFGMVYPHVFTEDEIAVTCTKCGAQSIIKGG